MDEATEELPRIPGVRYRKVTRYRTETTVIDGVPSTRSVEFEGWAPVPPREWDDLILRGVTGVIVGATGMAILATTASLGGLLSRQIPAVLAYGAGALFSVAWVTATAFEWLDRVDPKRSRPARLAGWLFLALSMGAVFTYGLTLHQPWAGGFGACVDVLTKGLWTLLIRHHAVPLDAGVAHWVTEQEQKLASRELLSGRLLRLNRRAAYHRAVGGAEFEAAAAILASAETIRTEIAPDASGTVSGQGPLVSGQASVPSVPAPPAHAPTVPAPPVAPVSGQASGTVSAQVTPPPVPSAPPVSGQAPVPAAPVSGQVPPPVPPIVQISRPGLAEICRLGIAADPNVSDADLYAAVLTAGHPDTARLADTVRRTAQRQDPTRKNRKSS